MKTIISVLGLLLFFSLNMEAGNNPLNDIEGEEYLAFAEVMAAPVGGMPAIYKLIKYPQIAVSAGVEGKVYLLAFVNENGDVDDVKIVKGIGAGCDEAAADAVKQTKFTPAQAGGKNVKIKISLPIEFKLKY